MRFPYLNERHYVRHMQVISSLFSYNGSATSTERIIKLLQKVSYAMKKYKYCREKVSI